MYHIQFLKKFMVEEFTCVFVYNSEFGKYYRFYKWL